MDGTAVDLGADDVLNCMRGNVLVVASDGTIQAAYGGGGAMAGHLNADVVGRNALDFLSPDSHAALLGVFLPDDSVPIVPHPTSFPIGIIRPDGETEEYDIVPTGFDQDGARGWVVLLTSRLHLPPAVEVLHSMSRGDSLQQTIAGVTRRMSVEVPGMPEVVRRSVSVLYPGSAEACVIPGCETAAGDVVAARVAAGDDTLWRSLDPDAITNAPVDSLPADLRAAMAADGTVQMIAIRIDAGGRTLFVMLCFMRDPNPGGLLGNTRLAVEQLRDAIRQAIEREEGRRALEEAASRDALTGLYNRTGFHRVATGSTAESAIVYVDLDGFKAINDTHGHAVGDAVLAEIAGRLRSACRPHDRIARLGGDEFAIVIDDADDAGVERVAGRLLAAIAEPLPADLGPRSVTASIGVARLADDEDLSDSLTAADLAMLAAKRAGRGRIVSA